MGRVRMETRSVKCLLTQRTVIFSEKHVDLVADGFAHDSRVAETHCLTRDGTCRSTRCVMVVGSGGLDPETRQPVF